MRLTYLRVVRAEGGDDVPGLLPRPDDGEPAGEGARRGGATTTTTAAAALAGAVTNLQAAGREGAVLGDLREVARATTLLRPGEVELGRLHLPAAAAAASFGATAASRNF